MKKKYIEAHMKAAEVYAQLSSAKRLQVGCVVVKDNTIIGIGYNGMPSGWDNTCEWTVDDAKGYDTGKSKPEVLHAETNAIAKIARSTNSSDGAALFVTHAPCLECAKIIHQAGIEEVFYRNSYRNDDGIIFLQRCIINVQKV
jgi:dCMP deaminase